jgi:hypothetical protein
MRIVERYPDSFPHSSVFVDLGHLYDWWGEGDAPFESMADIPCYRSPWDDTVVEYRGWIDFGEDETRTDTRVAIRFVTVDLDDDLYTGPEHRPGAVCRVLCEPTFMTMRNHNLFHTPGFFYDHGSDGMWNGSMGALDRRDFETDEESRAFFEEIATPFLAPIAWAFSVLSCRNVTTTNERPTRRLRALKRATGREIVYKTLMLDGKNIIKHDDSDVARRHELKKLHICRGHFATYGDDAPLFGKYTGRFWRPMHLRGSSVAGEVVKDYKVVPIVESV